MAARAEPRINVDAIATFICEYPQECVPGLLLAQVRLNIDPDPGIRILVSRIFVITGITSPKVSAPPA